MEENKENVPNNQQEQEQEQQPIQQEPTQQEQEGLEQGSLETPDDSTATHEATDALKDIQRLDVKLVFESTQRIKEEIAQVVVGQDDLLEYLMIGLLVRGHCLIEGLPGIAKTLTARSLAKTIDSSYSRIQFTPDLMPTDVSGTSVFNVKEGEFFFKKGPVFASIVLIDEINRSPAKTQAALMEIMEEHQLTYDGKTYPMEQPFFVIATQNPIEQEGTYQLPEAQLDRFIFRIKLGYPSLEEERQILELFESDFENSKENDLKRVLSRKQIEECRGIVEQVHIKKELIDYVARIVDNTRNNGDIYMGASPRASLAIMKASKALAAIRGRDFVTPDDIQHVCYPVLNHRLVISYEREMDGSTVEDIIKSILVDIEVPR